MLFKAISQENSFKILKNERSESQSLDFFVDVIITEIFLETVTLTFKAEKEIEGRRESWERLRYSMCLPESTEL